MNSHRLVNQAIAFGTLVLLGMSIAHFSMYRVGSPIPLLRVLFSGSLLLLGTTLVIYDAICRPVDSAKARIRRLWPWGALTVLLISTIAVDSAFYSPGAHSTSWREGSFMIYEAILISGEIALIASGIVAYLKFHDIRRVELRAFLCMVIGGQCGTLTAALSRLTHIHLSFYSEVPVAAGFLIATHMLACMQRQRGRDILKSLIIQFGRFAVLAIFLAAAVSWSNTAGREQLLVTVVLAASIAIFATGAAVPWALRRLQVVVADPYSKLRSVVERETDLDKLLKAGAAAISEEIDAAAAELTICSLGRDSKLSDNRIGLAKKAREGGPITARNAAMDTEHLSVVMHSKAGEHDLCLFLGPRSTIQPFGHEQIQFLEGALAIVGDVYSRLEVLQLAWHRERLAYVGQAFAVYSHEARNQLGGILDVLRLVAERKEDRLDDEHRQVAVAVCESILLEAENKLEFARGQHEEPAKIRLEEVLQDAMRLSEPMLRRKNVRLVSKTNGLEIEVLAGRRALRQVFINLLTNASDALSSTTDAMISITAESNRSHAKVILEDNGPGVPASIFDCLFAPYSTSKAAGTGLGLSFCRSVLSSMNGTIEYATPKGQPAARFVITIPYA